MATGPKNPTDRRTGRPLESERRAKRATSPSSSVQAQSINQAKPAATPIQTTFYDSDIPFIVVDPATIIAERPSFVSENDVYSLNRKLTTRLKHFNIQADPKIGFQELSRSLIKFFKENNTSEIDQLAITQEFRIANLELYHLYNGVTTKEINANMINLANLQFSIIENSHKNLHFQRQKKSYLKMHLNSS